MMQLDRVAPAITERIPEYRNIIAFRHVLVHGYDSLDPQTVWNVVETKLQGLRNKLNELIE